MMQRVCRVRWFLWAGVAALSLVGCEGSGDGLPREPLSGMVTIDGLPLKSGRIDFEPQQPEQRVPGGAAITDGKYAIPRESGLVPGAYTVRISSEGEAVTPDPNEPPGAATRPVKDPIPPRYNLQSELNAQVEKGGKNEFPFQLTTKKTK